MILTDILALLLPSLPSLALQQALALEHEDDRVDDLLDGLLGGVDDEVGLRWGLVRVVDAGEALNLATPRLRVDALAVHLLAVLERRSDVDEEEVATATTTVLDDVVTGSLAARLEGRDGSRDDGGTGAGELGGDVCDTEDVFVTVFVREAELSRQLASDGLSEQKRDGSTALLVEHGLQSSPDGILARVVETGEED